jgi:TIR domain
MPPLPGDKRDFFISFNKADRAWATWIAWVLEEAGYSVWFQDWDFRGNFIEHMNRAHVQADRTLAVLSDNYFGSDFTLAEWSARFAQDPAAREDRLVTVKVGPLTSESMLGPLIYADLTDCGEEEGQRQLLGRVKKAVDAAYRDKPPSRPGFPGNATRQVPSRPAFPRTETKAHAGPRTEKPSMAGSRSVSIGRDAISNIIVTGDRNEVHASMKTERKKTTLPPASSIDINSELAEIRAVLAPIGDDQAGKISRALDDAVEEARKPMANRDEVGVALSRALEYAQRARGFAGEITRLAPPVRNAVGWLGPNWQKLLPIVGLSAEEM